MPSEFFNDLQQPIGAPVADWQPCPRPPHTPMMGRWCRVEALDVEARAAALFEAFSKVTDGRNWTYLAYGPFSRFDEFHSWLTSTCAGNDPTFYTIIELATSRPVGLASYLRIEPDAGAIEVGHLHFSPSLQRTPAATEAMFLMMSRVFDELGYRRYEWKCDALNGPSRRAAMRLGFSFEGLFRQATIYKGRNRDTAWYSIIDQEWPAIRQALHQWLDPANFDEHGKQRRRLSEMMMSAHPRNPSCGYEGPS